MPDCTSDGVVNFNKIGLVHATFYQPQKGEDVCYELDALANANGLLYPRNTLHFAVGHHVASHMAGGWNDAPYVIITGLKDLSQKHDLPWGLSLVDTFFEVGLNENLHLPEDTHIIRPAIGPLPPEKDWITFGNTTFYRTSGFSEQSRQRRMQLDHPDDLRQGREVPESKLASDLKKGLVIRILQEKGFIPMSPMSPQNYHKEIERLAAKLGVCGTHTETLHAQLALTGASSPIADEITNVRNVTHILAQWLKLKEGIDIEAMLPPLGFKSKLTKYESLSGSAQEGQYSLEELSSKVKGQNILATFEQMQDVVSCITAETPQARENEEKSIADIKQAGLGNGKLDLTPGRWSQQRQKKIAQAPRKEQEVFRAWIQRSQQRVNAIGMALRQMEAKKHENSNLDQENQR